jgi:hypothetical protein
MRTNESSIHWSAVVSTPKKEAKEHENHRQEAHHHRSSILHGMPSGDRGVKNHRVDARTSQWVSCARGQLLESEGSDVPFSDTYGSSTETFFGKYA